MIQPVAQSYKRKGFTGPLLALFLADARVQHRQLCVFERCGAAKQMEALKYKANFLVSAPSQLFLIQL